jgi:hypothetical protein
MFQTTNQLWWPSDPWLSSWAVVSTKPIATISTVVVKLSRGQADHPTSARPIRQIGSMKKQVDIM